MSLGLAQKAYEVAISRDIARHIPAGTLQALVVGVGNYAVALWRAQDLCDVNGILVASGVLAAASARAARSSGTRRKAP